MCRRLKLSPVGTGHMVRVMQEHFQKRGITDKGRRNALRDNVVYFIIDTSIFRKFKHLI